MGKWLCTPCRTQFALMASVLLGAAVGHADQEAADKAVNAGDTAWILISAALVLLMTPALAFFYAGMVREKNVLNTLLMSLGAAAIIGVTWILVGYSLAFSEGQLLYRRADFAC